MRLKTVYYTRKNQSEKIELSNSGSEFGTNYITIIHGENGTGKSSLLRAISDISLGRSLSRQRGGVFSKIRGDFIGGPPVGVIALSGTINDRFPITSSGDLRLTVNSFDLEQFSYFGPKYSRGIASHARTSSNIARSIFSGIRSGWDFEQGLTHLMRYLGFKPQVQMKFEWNKSRQKKLPEYLNDLQGVLKKVTREVERIPDHVHDAQMVIDFLISSGELPQGMEMESRDSTMVLDFDIETGKFLENVSIGEKLFPNVNLRALDEIIFISSCLSIGLLRSTISFQALGGDEFIEIEDMSSGQWQLANCMFNLCANLENDTVVLIDEPENSMHPQWQRDYVALVGSMMAHRTGCHVLIATHSPLLVSSLLPEKGNLIQLSRDNETKDLQIVAKENAYGWIPGDVLRERFDLLSERPPEFAEAINAALRILRSSDGQADRLKPIAEELVVMRSRLPPYDTIRRVIDVIVKEAGLDDSDAQSDQG